MTDTQPCATIGAVGFVDLSRVFREYVAEKAKELGGPYALEKRTGIPHSNINEMLDESIGRRGTSDQVNKIIAALGLSTARVLQELALIAARMEPTSNDTIRVKSKRGKRAVVRAGAPVQRVNGRRQKGRPASQPGDGRSKPANEEDQRRPSRRS